MRLVGYLRVSTRAQAEDGLGLDVQRDAITRWARAGGQRVTVWHADEGASGTLDATGRAGLAEALRAVRDGRAQGLVVWRLDRLARDLVLQEALLAEVRRLGGTLRSTVRAEDDALADDAADPSRRLVRQVLGAVSEYERGMTVLRMQSGRARKAATGGYAYGAPRYGTRAEGRALVAEPAEAAAVARARALHRQGASLRQVADALSAEGHRPRRGERWHPTTVARLVRAGDRTRRG